MSLLRRIPGAALLDVLPPPDRREALDDADAWQGRAEVAEAERDQLDRELRDVAAERDAAVAERDDLSVRVLPMRGLRWFETTDPPGTVSYDQTVQKESIDPAEPFDDGADLREQISEFAAQYGGWPS
jgi:hypothetical protein